MMTTSLKIAPVRTWRERRQFLELPWSLYRGDPHWIPPMRGEQKALVGYRPHPFYRTAEVQTFLAYRQGGACGRIAAILNHAHNQHYREKRGFVGFFECVDDLQVAQGLFEAAQEWFHAKGVHSLRGPVNPGLEYMAGLLVDGFDSAPAFQMTHNPPFYARLLEGCGFRKSQDLLAYRLDVRVLPAYDAKLRPLADQIIARYGIRVRPLRLPRDLEAFVAIYNRSMARQWGYYPMEPAEVRHMTNQLRYLLVPDFALGAEVDGQLVGVAIGVLDYNAQIRQIDGRLLPFGWLKMLTRRRGIKRLCIQAVNVLPEWQSMGLPLVLSNTMIPNSLKWGIEEVEYSWILESNPRSFGNLEKFGAEPVKRYRIYDWSAQDAKSEHRSVHCGETALRGPLGSSLHSRPTKPASSVSACGAEKTRGS